MECDGCSQKQMQIDDLKEKLKLSTADYATSQMEYQNLFIENNKKEREIKKVQSNYISLEQQLTDLGQRYRDQDKRLQVLSSENIALKKQMEKVETEQGLYEVEKIIQHKRIREKFSYLIRWAGYGADEDAWIMEDNLHCEDILDSYKKKHNL